MDFQLKSDYRGIVLSFTPSFYSEDGYTETKLGEAILSRMEIRHFWGISGYWNKSTRCIEARVNTTNLQEIEAYIDEIQTKLSKAITWARVHRTLQESIEEASSTEGTW